MGQAINAMHRRLLGTEAGNLSVVDRFWRIGQRIIQFLRRLFGRGAGKSPSDEAMRYCWCRYITDGEVAIASVEEKLDSSRSYITDGISLVPEFGHLQVKQRTGGIIEILSEITIGEGSIPLVEVRDDNSRSYITDEISPVSEFRHPNAEKQACDEILFERTFAEVVIASVEEKACRSASYITDRISPVLEKRLKNTNLGPPSDYQIPICPSPDDNHFIDIGIDDLAFHSRIPEISLTLVETGDELPPVEQRPSEIEEQVLECFICDVGITKAETADGGVSYITDNLSPAEERPINRRLGPYSWDQKILLVGEGDFSFSASLAVAFDDASNMIATSLDSFGFLVKNYKRAKRNIEEIINRGGKVVHRVDATKMANHPELQSLKFDCIVYNFPYVGFAYRCDPNISREVEISKHQELVRGFLANAKTMMEPDGEIHITHKCVKFSLEWNLEMLGSTEGLQLVEESPFNFRVYPGYSTKYGFGGDKNFHCTPAKTYKFQLGKAI